MLGHETWVILWMTPVWIEYKSTHHKDAAMVVSREHKNAIVVSNLYIQLRNHFLLVLRNLLAGVAAIPT